MQLDSDERNGLSRTTFNRAQLFTWRVGAGPAFRFAKPPGRLKSSALDEPADFRRPLMMAVANIECALKGVFLQVSRPDLPSNSVSKMQQS